MEKIDRRIVRKWTSGEFMIYAADLFCGAGGTSTGLVNALVELGYSTDDINLLAINHWDVAIATHAENHPWAAHKCENLDNVNPRQIVPGGYLDLLVASPECTHHSRARGGRPINDQSRASAWHVLRWAEALYIKNILIENVPEFMTWGPVDRDGSPIQALRGKTFLAFVESLRSLGYNVDYRVLNAADYGDPTTRKRLFIMASRDNAVCWPEPSHGKVSQDMFGKRKPWRSARDIIDWDLPSESIFSRKTPLKPNTMRRIMKGLEKFSGLPFIVQYHGGDHADNRSYPVSEPIPTVDTSNRYAVCQPYIVALNHGSDENRSYSLSNPFPTVTSVDAWGLVEPYLVKMYGSSDAASIDAPLPTVTAQGQHLYLAEPFIVSYYGTGGPKSIDEPLDTVTSKDRFGLVLPLKDGSQVCVDIRFRMLQPQELAAAMSFPKSYKFSGKRGDQVKQIGNAVPGNTAKALCKSFFVRNYGN